MGCTITVITKPLLTLLSFFRCATATHVSIISEQGADVYPSFLFVVDNYYLRTEGSPGAQRLETRTKIQHIISYVGEFGSLKAHISHCNRNHAATTSKISLTGTSILSNNSIIYILSSISNEASCFSWLYSPASGSCQDPGQ